MKLPESTSFGLAGEERLVDLEPARLHDLAVDHHLEAGLQLEQVVGHDLAQPDVGGHALTHHTSGRRVEHCQRVQRLAGA
jgi:hypothetical protein